MSMLSSPLLTMNSLFARSLQRLIVFHHNGPSCQQQGQCPNGMHNLYRYASSTPFGLTGIRDVLDFKRSCSIMMGAPWAPFLISNHFANSRLGLPNREIASTINKKSVIESRIEACTKLIGKRPNFLVVDFWSHGDLVEVTQRQNQRIK